MRSKKTSDSYGDHVNLEHLLIEKVKNSRNWINTRIGVTFLIAVGW